MKVYLNLKNFTNKLEIIQAIKIFKTNNKDVIFTINAKNEDTIILNRNSSYVLIDEENENIFNTYKEYDYVILKDATTQIKEKIFKDTDKDFLNLSFILKENNFRSYFFEYSNSINENDLVASIEKSISCVKKEKSKDDITIGFLKNSYLFNNIISHFQDIDIQLIDIEDFLTSKNDLIITDSLVGSIMKSSFKAINNFYKKDEENKKRGFSFQFMKSNTSPIDVTQFFSKYSFIFKDKVILINVNYEMTINEFLAILANLTC